MDAILDKTGNIVTIVNERFLFETYRYTNKLGGEMVGIAYPANFVQRFGLRIDEYVDVTLERVRRTRRTLLEKIRGVKSARGDVEIFPRVLRYGDVAIRPQAFGTIAPGQVPDRLITLEFLDQFYADMILELNYAYGYGLHRSSEVLFRALIENLLIDLLRDKYTMSNVNLFFDTSRGRFQDLAVLISNLRTGLPDFAPYSASIDKAFCDILDGYRDTGNSSAHKLEATAFNMFPQAKQPEMARVVSLLKSTIEKIRGRNL